MVAFFLPPVVGAGIGLFTNWLAIKMLFRPLMERRIFGVRVPFTPGILPRERTRISSSMGDTVATDLLDDETVAARLRSPAFKEAIRQGTLNTARKILDAKPADLSAGLDSRIVELVKEISVEALAGFTASDTFASAVVAGKDAAVASAGSLSLDAFIDPATVSRLSAALASPRGSEVLGAAMAVSVINSLERAARDGKTVSSFIDPEALRAFSAKIIDAAYPSLIAGTKKFFSDTTVTASMEKVGARLIRRTFDRFNSVQRFFIGLGQYDKAILDNMPATIADFSESLEALLTQDSTRVAIKGRVSSMITALAEKPLSSLAFLSDSVQKEVAIESLSQVLRDALASIDADAVGEQVGKLLKTETVGQVLAMFPGLADRMGPALARWASSLFGKEFDKESPVGKVASAFFSTFSSTFRLRASDVSLGSTLAIDDDALEAMAASASEGLAELAAAESSNMVRSIDIRSLVIEKIDSLNMIDVERMILRVVDKELRAITLFGGVLGALIGVAQSLLFLLR
jgi:uncharacterized membrane protein YheB (UPF0754 family)